MANEPRRVAPSYITELDWGVHFCCFYETKSDFLNVVIPFLEEGLTQNELCLWILSASDPVSKDEAWNALQSAIANFEQHASRGSIEIFSDQEWFFPARSFDLARVIQRFADKVGRATDRKYRGIRVCGTPIKLRKRNPGDLWEYEQRLDALIANSRMKVLCMYPILESDAADVWDVSRTHGAAAVVRHGKLEVLETTTLARAKQEIVRFNQDLEQRILDRTRELAAANERLRNEIAERVRTENELGTQAEILQKIFDNILVMINFVDASGRFRLVNREWERVLGWTLQEIEEQGLDIFAECYPDPDYRRKVLKFLRSSRGSWRDFETRVRSGHIINTTWTIVRLSDGTSIGIGQDITERKRAEEKLRQTLGQLQLLAERLNSVREEEKRHIALEIHDQIGQVLTAVRINLKMLSGAAASRKTLSRESLLKELHSSIRLVDGSMMAVRRIASHLRLEVLEGLGLKRAVVTYAREFERTTGIQCSVVARTGRISPQIEHAIPIFRIFQEALTNVARHSRASRVWVRIYTDRNHFRFEVRDNGKGIKKSEAGGSLGIAGMKERALLLGGTLTVRGRAPRGTVVHLAIPLRHLRKHQVQEGAHDKRIHR